MPARLLALLILAALLILNRTDARPSQPVAIAAGNAFGGPVNGGCYAQTASLCRIHIDSWMPISVTQGEKLLGFRLLANGNTLYDFRTDVNNPPGGPYLTSPVARDFAAQCGADYTLTLLVEDSGSGGLVESGSTNLFTCPLLETPTSTPTNTPTRTPTPSSTAILTATPTTAVPTESANDVYLPALRR